MQNIEIDALATTTSPTKIGLVIIVAGYLSVDPDDRVTYLDACRAVVAAARATAGCLDYQLGADILDGGRINVFEAWRDIESVEAFRGAGPDDDLASMIKSAQIRQYEIASATDLTG